MHRGADKSLARPTSRCLLFDGENISFDASLVIYINSTNISPIMITNRIYENQNLLSLWLVSFLVGLRTYQHPCSCNYDLPCPRYVLKQMSSEHKNKFYYLQIIGPATESTIQAVVVSVILSRTKNRSLK